MLSRENLKSSHVGFSHVAEFTLFLILVALWSCSPQAKAAQIFVVDPPQKSSVDAPPTMTLLYSVENPQVTVIAIPGGEGHLRFKETTTGTRNQTALMLRNLTRADLSKLRTNVVIFDSPYEIFPYDLRKSADHLDRIENVIRYYKKKFNTPIWLLGHSWGSVSVTEFINRSPEARALLAGVITSGSKYEIEIKDSVSMPILFLHHRQDGCRATPYGYAQSNFEKVKSTNKRVTEIATVKGGEEVGDPCRNGYHMYVGAYEEAAKFVEKFISRNHPTIEKNASRQDVPQSAVGN